jgi:hypothetical protein
MIRTGYLMLQAGGQYDSDWASYAPGWGTICSRLDTFLLQAGDHVLQFLGIRVYALVLGNHMLQFEGSFGSNLGDHTLQTGYLMVQAGDYTVCSRMGGHML